MVESRTSERADNTTAVPPLAGLKVLDLTRVLAGPYCTMILADLGADVVKIERPETGDEARSFGPFMPSGASAYFASLNRGKSSIVLDLKVDADRDTFLKLAKQADVLVENFRPGVMDALGIGADVLHEFNPSLIMASASGFGQTGPYRDRPAYDVIIQAMSGLMSITGHDADNPVRVGASISDIVTGMFSAIGILAALHAQEPGKCGATLDLAMLDCNVAILENAIARCELTGKTPEPIGTRHPSITPFQGFPTSDGTVVIAAGNDGLWKKLCGVLEAPELAADPLLDTNSARTENQSHLEQLISERTRQRPMQEWLTLLEAAGIPAAPIQTISDMMNDQHLHERGMFHQIRGKGDESFTAAGSPFRIDGCSLELSDQYPELGADRTSVVSRWLPDSE
ncbi:MAG: CoA transferase [Fuerstiella sp.]|nr:CoA transferase [Fuerstiella sp.]MCP4857216.1 CoA transferase [Fuerstiella sp.]